MDEEPDKEVTPADDDAELSMTDPLRVTPPAAVGEVGLALSPPHAEWSAAVRIRVTMNARLVCLVSKDDRP
jgi:hypothetical protein